MDHHPSHRKIRILQVAEDADDGSELVVYEVPKPPEWACEHCATRNNAEWGTCAMCGREREDGW